MSEDQPKCGLCGHPMPKGEEAFQYHGYSGPCPELPELTDEERAVLDAIDMTEILVAWEARFHVAKNTVMRLARERNDLTQRLAAAEALLREASTAISEYYDPEAEAELVHVWLPMRWWDEAVKQAGGAE